MGVLLSLMEKLRSRGVFADGGGRILDIGSSNLYQADAAAIAAFVRSFPQADVGPDLPAFAEKLARGSGYDAVRGGLNEAFVGELIDRCGMTYLSFDIARGYKTEIFDLNRQDLPPRHRGAWDVVLNIGTTEHVLNQQNSFTIIHEAARAGGFIVHQLPVAGFTDHAYYVYTSRLFFDLAGFNAYEIVDLWYEGPSGGDNLFQSLQAYRGYFPALQAASLPEPLAIPNVALTIIYRKTADRPFVGALEMSTSVGSIPEEVRSAYAADKAAAAPDGGQVPGLRALWRRLRGG